MSALVAGILLLSVLLALAYALFGRAVRRGLAAPRVARPAGPPGGSGRPVAIPTVNDKILRGWLLPASVPEAPALVVMHGWGGNAEMMLPVVAPLREAGFAMLLVDARCHGLSDEDSFASLPRFAEDIEASLAWLAQQPEADPRRLGVLGHSVGAGAALLVASRSGRPRAVVSIAAFAHPARMMRRWLTAKRIPHWPLGAAILWYVQRTIGCRFAEIAPLTTIGRARCPVLLLHGDRDDVVPATEAEEIHAARGGAPVELAWIPGSHDDYGDAAEAAATAIAFLQRHLCPGGPWTSIRRRMRAP